MFVFDLPEKWVVPLWILSAGTTAALLVVIAGIGITWLASREAGRSLLAAVREGVLFPLGIVGAFLAALFLLGALIPQMPAAAILRSLIELPRTGPVDGEITIAAGTTDEPIELPLRTDRVASLRFSSDAALTLRAYLPSEPNRSTDYYLRSDRPGQWTRAGRVLNPLLGPPKQFMASNLGARPATLRYEAVTVVEHPESIAVATTFVATLALVGVYFLVYRAAPKISAIASATYKEAVMQPLFYLVVSVGAVLLLVFIFLPYNTFGEDIKMVKMNGITLVKVLTVMVMLWTASVSIHEELEGRTALTLLSKPIGRRSFILGKFLGIVWAAVLMFVVLGLFFLATVALKTTYEARETSSEATWQLCYENVAGCVPGLVLGLLETIILSSISVALATKFPALANLLFCVTIYGLGHLVPVIVQSPQGQFPIVSFVGQLLSAILPVLMHFTVDAAVIAGEAVPPAYLLTSTLYAALYCTFSILVALVLFEDRDLA